MRRGLLRFAGGLLGVTVMLLVVGWLSLHWLILPHIDRWREPIERRASSVIGAPVRIGSISVQSGRWVPTIELRDVQLLDAEQRVALALPRVVAALSARSLLAFDVRFAQLLIEGASLDVRRDAAGRIRVGGIDFGSGQAGSGDGAAADWFFAQHEFAIRGGSLRWVDEMRPAPPLVLADVELVVRNGLRSHALRIDATPPSEWGDRFSVRGELSQPLFAKNGDWRRWSGTVFASLPRADVRELRRHLSLPFDLSEGDGALRAWIDVRAGRPVAATVDVALRAVTLRLERDVEPLDVEHVLGRIRFERDDAHAAVHARALGFVTGDGLRWPSSDFDIAWQQRDGGAVSGGEITASRLDLGVMAEIARSVPLGKPMRALLAELRPQGVVNQLNSRWQGPLDAPERYSLKGSLSGLGLAAHTGAKADVIGRPGLDHASVELDANESGGKAHLVIANGRLELPGVFDDPLLPLAELDAKLHWKIDRRQPTTSIAVALSSATFANADLHGELSANWHTGSTESGRFPGQLDLNGRLSNADASRLHRYLPLGLPDGVRSYLGRAVRSGTIASADIRVRGDLADFPFVGKKRAAAGEFRVATQVRDLVFAYIPDEATPPLWPPLTGGAGEIIVDRGALEIRDASAELGGVAWGRLRGRIAEPGEAARLEIEGNARGALADMVRFVNTTPVGRWTGGALAAVSANGAADLRLALAIPLADAARSSARGSLVLAGNDLRMTADTPLLAAARGRVDFTHRGFTVSGGSARVLGGDLSFEGGSSNGLAGGDGQRFSGQGVVTAEALRRSPELGAVARLAGALSGQASYRASLAFAEGRPQMQFASNLVGMTLELPAPLGKAAATPLPLVVRSEALASPAAAGVAGTGPNTASAAAPRVPADDELQVELGNLFAAHFVRSSGAEGRARMRGAVKIGALAPRAAASAVVRPAGSREDFVAASLPLPADGVQATLELDRLDLDAWQAAATRLGGDDVAAPAAGAGAKSSLAFDASGGAIYVPDRVGLNVRLLEAGGRHFTGVSAGLSQAGGLWRGNVVADEVEGYAEYRPARRSSASAAGRVYARLTRLKLPREDAERVEQLLEEPPASIPALDVVVDAFELRGKQLGRLEIDAANRGGREWTLLHLNLSVPEAKLQASGTWAAARPGATRQAALRFELAVSDSGALLERLGVGRVVRGGKGQLTGELAWPGSPLSPDVARMTGDVKIALESGQFLKASPGAARLLGVLSLQSLPRRLLLDFRDVFEDGFAFDDVVGDVAIAKGLATTNNLRMRGAAAAVLMEGSADLERETEDLRVVVVPEINAGTASLAYAVINPAVGLGTFLAQYFLKKPLTAAITREFHVTGPWEDPKVERVERRIAAAASAAEASAPAAIVK